MTRILLDQGLSRSTATLLRVAGWDAVHVHDIGLSTSSDSVIIQSARMNNQIICTLDADFRALLAVSGSETPSVIRIRRDGLRGGDLASLLLACWRAIEPAVASGAMITKDRWPRRCRRA